ncbi:protein krasavietz [Aricia agestis]|uniref:protein krasavietz n=1 Tax=Aricia agestis TaxID=91739 RepID=UPI001C20998D|nr:protein krasavietz [Aricia agestis]XP_041982805.1 protein krasavietz [Aricia agestis]
MSQKVEKPVLSGQRIKTRKRDEKEKYDPNGFRDALVAGLERAGGDLDAAYKFLDAAGSKLDYRRYGEVIFDVLIAGGLLLPGGSVSMDGETPKTNTCIFNANEDMDTMRNFEQIFLKLMRRYKYLEKMFEEEMKKVLVYIKGFEPQNRIKLARMVALWIGNACVPPSVLLVLVNEHLVKDNLALDFVLEVFATVKQERGAASLVTALKRGQLEGRLLEFLPLNRRGEEALASALAARGLSELLKLHRAQAEQEARRALTAALRDELADERAPKDLVPELRDLAVKLDVPDHEVVAIIWYCVMARGEWNKKEELLAEQAAKYLRQYTPLFAAFCQSAKAEIALLTKVQEYCYENMSFMKAFSKLVLMLYKTNVLSEEVILKWYREPNSSKGKVMFLDQMKKFVEWLQSAEEESESGEEED